MSKPFYIIGFMGTGKSSLAPFLKQNGKVDDLDEIIESRIKMDIATYFKQSGEEAFRDHESKALKETDGDFILTGGGVVERSVNMEWMQRHGTVVHLSLPFEDCWERIKDSERPLVRQGKAAVKSLYLRRLSLYEQADVRVDASRPPREVAQYIIQLKEEEHGLD